MSHEREVVYIAGPMTGYANFNRPSFRRLAEALRNEGNVVLSPADLPDGLDYAEYMDITMAMVRAADTVYRMAGWCNSKGASAEIAYAASLGKVMEGWES